MSDIDELAEDLGVDQGDTQTEQAKMAEISEVNTQEQIVASEKLINRCKKIYQRGRENDLVWRWLIGKEVKDAYEHAEKYEEGILKKLSTELFMAISDLSRFHKFFKSFDKDMLVKRAEVGYTWSHFKAINDLPDGELKDKMIDKITKEDDVPKVKELQSTINEEREPQDGSSSDGPSPLRPVNGALRTIDKLLSYLTDIHIQEKEGINFNSDKQHEKYDSLMDEINDRMKEVEKFRDEIWS